MHGHLRLVDARCGECAVAPQAQRHANGAAERIGDDIVNVADTVCARIEMEDASELGDLDAHRCGAAHRYSHPRRQPEEPGQEESHRHEQHDVHAQLQDGGHTVGADIANELQRVELGTQMVCGAVSGGIPRPRIQGETAKAKHIQHERISAEHTRRSEAVVTMVQIDRRRHRQQHRHERPQQDRQLERLGKRGEKPGHDAFPA